MPAFRPFRARVLTCLALACVVPACAATTVAAATVPTDFYGVNSGGTLVTDAVARPAALRTMRAGGLSFVRVDASWGGVEPVPPVAGQHVYVWAVYDLFVADLARNGLRWYPMVGYSAPWAASTPGDPFAPPAGDENFAAYAGALAGRYGSAGSFWAEHPELPRLPVTTYGIWNEPTNPSFWRGPEATPARYMRLYLAARAAIRAADPSARAATAGMLDSGSVDGSAFLRAMLDSAPSARGQVDAIGWHPYVGNVEQIIGSVAGARAVLEQRGLASVPIEISEVGWFGTGGYTGVQRAAMLRTLAAQLPYEGLNVTRLLPYVWTGDPVWQITAMDGSPGLVGGAYFAGIRDARAPRRAAPVAKAKRRAAKARKSCRLPASRSARTRAKSTRRCALTAGVKHLRTA
jgi:hypothetical protein